MHFTVYIAASQRHVHAVRLLNRQLMAAAAKIRIFDWTDKGTDTLHNDAGHDAIFSFCRNASLFCDLLIYFGASGQDSGVEVGMAYAAGVPVIGIKGRGEEPGVMLRGAVTVWKELDEAILAVRIMANCRERNCSTCALLDMCRVGIDQS